MYTLNIYFFCQSYFNKGGEKKKEFALSYPPSPGNRLALTHGCLCTWSVLRITIVQVHVNTVLP